MGVDVEEEEAATGDGLAGYAGRGEEDEEEELQPTTPSDAAIQFGFED